MHEDEGRGQGHYADEGPAYDAEGGVISRRRWCDAFRHFIMGRKFVLGTISYDKRARTKKVEFSLARSLQ